MAQLKPFLKFPGLHYFYTRGELTDATVNVRGSEIKLHKIVLISKSPVFRAMFQSEMREGRTDFIKIDDADPEVFREVVHYLYCGVCPNLKTHHLGIFECADKYGLTELVEICEGNVMSCIDVSSAVQYLTLADMHCRERLKDKIFVFIKRRLRAVMKTVDWPSVDFRLKTELIQRFSNRNHSLHRGFPPTDENTIEIKSDKTVTWCVNRNLLSCGSITSPRFQIIINGEIVNFCYILRHDRPLFYGIDMVIHPHLKAPLSLDGHFVLHELGKDVFETEKTLTWTQKDIGVTWTHGGIADPWRKTILSRLKKVLLNKVKLSFTIPDGSPNYLKKHEPKLVSNFEPYINSERFSDVEFEVEGQTFFGHRVVLATASAYFEKMFQHQEDRNLFTEMTAKDFNIVLQYLYTNELPADPDVDEKTLDAARVCGLDALYDQCESSLISGVTLQTAVQTLISGHNMSAFRLKERAKWFIIQNIQTASAHPSWNLLSQHPDLVNELLFDL